MRLTAKFKSHQKLIMPFLDKIAKFNAHQYFPLYGVLNMMTVLAYCLYIVWCAQYDDSISLLPIYCMLCSI